ncbi:MAG: hypothetical protein R8G66_25495 [Cytophagales bacterium]|nr:hypothetical protein [Cytophagales bacterium]
MSDKQENIEDFVRKVVDQSEAQIPFNESHWTQMESMLDAQLPVVTNPGNGYYYFSNVVSLLVGLVFVWSWFIGSGSNETPASIQGAGDEVMPTKDALTTDVAEDFKPEGQVQSVATTEGQSEKVSDVDPVTPVGQNASENTASVISPDTGKEVQQIESLAEKETQTTTGDPQRISSLSAKDAPTSSSIVSSDITSSPSSNDVQEASNVQKQIVESPKESPTIPISESASNDEVTSVQPETALLDRDEEDNSDYELFTGIGIDLSGEFPEFPDQLDQVQINEADGGSNEVDSSPIVRRGVRSSYSRLSMGISLAPDLSSNEIFRYNRLGRDLGIVVDYWVTPRLAISVGAFNTSKRYLVGGEEYSPPAGFWGNVTNGERPAKIDADCQVLDIPINLKYQLVDRPKLNVYASAGVSSYIMLQEDYQYELESGWKSEWGVSNANQHFFGVGNLQVHFERRFGNHLAVEVAPFFKVPLTSYGHGNIRFHSMGSFFTIRKYLLNR